MEPGFDSAYRMAGAVLAPAAGLMIGTHEEARSSPAAKKFRTFCARSRLPQGRLALPQTRPDFGFRRSDLGLL